MTKRGHGFEREQVGFEGSKEKGKIMLVSKVKKKYLKWRWNQLSCPTSANTLAEKTCIALSLPTH